MGKPGLRVNRPVNFPMIERIKISVRLVKISVPKPIQNCQYFIRMTDPRKRRSTFPVGPTFSGFVMAAGTLILADGTLINKPGLQVNRPVNFP